jgi:hypothetical protein
VMGSGTCGVVPVHHDLQGTAANRAAGEVCVSGHCNVNNKAADKLCRYFGVTGRN